MTALDNFRVAYVDVDLTLILWPDMKPVICKTLAELKASGAVLNAPLAEALRLWWLDEIMNPAGAGKNAARELVIWSAHGAAHARAAAKWACLDEMAMACLTKPQVLIDDNELWIKKRTWLSPNLEPNPLG